MYRKSILFSIIPFISNIDKVQTINFLINKQSSDAQTHLLITGLQKMILFLPNPGVLFAFWLLSFLAKQQKQNYPFLPLSYALLRSKKKKRKRKRKINFAV